MDFGPYALMNLRGPLIDLDVAENLFRNKESLGIRFPSRWWDQLLTSEDLRLNYIREYGPLGQQVHGGEGLNPYQLSPDHYGMFKARPGHKLITLRHTDSLFRALGIYAQDPLTLEYLHSPSIKPLDWLRKEGIEGRKITMRALSSKPATSTPEMEALKAIHPKIHALLARDEPVTYCRRDGWTSTRAADKAPVGHAALCMDVHAYMSGVEELFRSGYNVVFMGLGGVVVEIPRHASWALVKLTFGRGSGFGYVSASEGSHASL